MVDSFVKLTLALSLVFTASAQTLLIDSGSFTQTGAFTSDQSYVGGAVYTDSNLGTGPWRTQRYGTLFSYLIPIPNGSYEVEVQMSEPNTANTAGKRLFTVNVNGQLSGVLDLFLLAGPRGQYRHISQAKVVNETLSVAFKSSVGNAVVNSILIRKLPPHMVTDIVTVPVGTQKGDIVKYTLTKNPVKGSIVLLLEGGSSSPPYSDLYVIKLTPTPTNPSMRDFEIKMDYAVSATTYLQFLYTTEEW